MGTMLSFISKLNITPPDNHNQDPPINDLIGPLLFILGAEMSVSSGLKIYKGKNGIYPENTEKILCPSNLYQNPQQVWDEIKKISSARTKDTVGPAYVYLKEFHKLSPNSMFLTQNVDGIIRKVGIDDGRVWEMHGQLRTMTCLNPDCIKRVHHTNLESPYCPTCETWCRPDIVLFEEEFESDGMEWVKREISRVKPKYVVVVGTPVAFSYLGKIIQQAKQVAKRSGCIVININPDSDFKFPVPNSINFCENVDSGLRDILEVFKRNI